MAHSQYDLAFIGAGISSAYTLLHLLEELRGGMPRQLPLRMLVIDKDPVFWTGVPYGPRSGSTALTITSLDDFLSASETEAFSRWLSQNYERLLSEFESSGGLLSADWIRNNGAELSRGVCKELYLPRFFFGAYMKERVSMLLAFAQQANLVECELRRAEAKEVEKVNGGFRIHLHSPGQAGELVDTHRIVLAAGSPPRQGFTHGLSHHPDVQARFIQDSHAPGLPNALTQISKALTTSDGDKESRDGKVSNVLIIGANASALELVYGLMDDGNLPGKPLIHVLSPGGEPEHWTAAKDRSRSFHPRHLPAAAAATTRSAQNILSAVAEDVNLARAQGFSLADTIGPISAAMLPALDKLDSDEQLEFVRFHSVEIGRLQRRAGGPYQDAARSLIAGGQLRFVRGRFTSVQPDQNGLLLVNYLDDGHQELTLSTPMSAVINCTGFQNLQRSPSPLISSLIANGICVPNSSQRGFEVNERFESVDGAYVMGPLLAGNLNATLRVWHAESCARICGLGRQLAGIIAEDLRSVVPA